MSAVRITPVSLLRAALSLASHPRISALDIFMKITLGQLAVAFRSGALLRLYQSKTPARVGYQVKHLMKEAEDKMSTHRLELINTIHKYGGKEVDNNGQWKFPDDQPDNIQACKKEVDELNAVEVELHFEPFSI